jgi:hypothetical protein
MKFAIPAIAAEDLDLAASAQIGVESLLSVSWSNAMSVGTLVQTGATTGTWAPDGAYASPDPQDMVILCDNGVLSDAEVDITFDVHYEGGVGGTVGTAMGTLIPPSYALNQGFNLPIGFAVDLTVQGAGNSAKKIVSIDGLNAIAGGKAGNRWRVFVLPSDFQFVACAMDKNPGLPGAKSIAIPCGYDGARWIKKGHSEVPTLECSAKYTSYGDGLMRLNGHRITAMLEVVKDDRLLTERAIFLGWRPTITARHGDGDTEDEARATGNYENVAVFAT